MFTSEGASAEREGTPTTPAAAITVEPGQDTVSLVLPAAALGKPRSLSGLKIYVTTWDYDGGYRALTPEGATYTVGGGAAVEPRVMDASEVIVLP